MILKLSQALHSLHSLFVILIDAILVICKRAIPSFVQHRPTTILIMTRVSGFRKFRGFSNEARHNNISELCKRGIECYMGNELKHMVERNHSSKSGWASGLQDADDKQTPTPLPFYHGHHLQWPPELSFCFLSDSTDVSETAYTGLHWLSECAINSVLAGG